MSKAVAKQETQAPAVIDYTDMVGMGMENADSDDFAVPFVYPVQKNSKVIDVDPDARPGMLYNSVTGSLYKELICIPCEFQKEYVEWIPLDDGGGFIGRHDWDAPIVAEAVQSEKDGKFYLENGHQLVDTRKHYVICISPETGEIFPAIIAMTSTQCKKSRRWLSTMANKKLELADGRKITPPTFAYGYRVTTIQESKDSYTWYGYVIQSLEQVDDADIFNQAHELYQSVKAGATQESVPQQ